MSFTSLQHTNAVVPSGDICIYTDVSAATRVRLWDTQTQLAASLACLWRPGPQRVRLTLVRAILARPSRVHGSPDGAHGACGELRTDEQGLDHEEAWHGVGGAAP